jgi:hypothetical protein
MAFGFRYLVTAACLLLSAPTVFAQSETDYSQVQERVAELKSSIPSQEQDNSFKIEQEEFERMRQQLIDAENSIVQEAAASTSDDELKIYEEEEILKNEIKAAATIKNSAAMPQAISEEITQKPINTDYKISNSVPKKPTLTTSNDKVTILEQELQDARNKLLVAEAEIERLNNLISNQKSAQPAAKNDSALVFSTAYGAQETTESDNYDLVITVVTDKTSLRGGPDKSAIRIMELSKGARLKVEDRQGDWFRITTKSGTRAWVSAKDVAFGPTDSASPTNTVRIRPIAIEQSDEEARAFDLIKNHTKNK